MDTHEVDTITDLLRVTKIDVNVNVCQLLFVVAAVKLLRQCTACVSKNSNTI